jgi:hypothetical protein
VTQTTKGAISGALLINLVCRLFFVTVVALGRSAHLFVAALAGSLVGGGFGDFDLCGFSFVALGTITQLFGMGLVVEGYVAFRGFVDDVVGSNGDASAGECDQQQHDNQFFHGFPPEVELAGWPETVLNYL